MKKIAIFVKNLSSGGAEKQSVLLAKALSTEYQVSYIIFNGEKTHQKYISLLKEEQAIYIKTLKGNRIQRYKALIDYIKENKIEIIFSYLTAANAYACLVNLQVKAKIYSGLRNSELPYAKCLADKFLTNRIAHKSIANCYSGKQNFVKKGFNPNKIVVIPNCFENIEPYFERNEIRPTRIITVGRFVAQKDFETAIKSIALLKKNGLEINFDIIGYGELENRIRAWIKKYDIEDITNIFINPNNISDLLKQADIYLSTSLFEGTSNSIMEGMNANLPIVATDVGDNSHLVHEGKNGFLCAIKDYKTISNCLTSLISNHILRKEMGKQSKYILQENYSMDIFRKRYLELLLE